MRGYADSVRLVQRGLIGTMEQRADVPLPRVRESDAPRRLLLKVKHGMRRGYTFKDLASLLGVSHGRLRQLIWEAFQ